MNHKILVVENDLPNSSRAVRALRTAGFRVVAPASPTTAVATFDRVRPDLVLIGRSLPDDGGAALCLEIKKTAHGARTPVALLLDEVGIDLPPMEDLGWNRLIESSVGDDELVSICRQLIDVPGGRMPAAEPPEAGSGSGSLAGHKSLEDVIDQVLTFEHEETVAHVQRTAAELAASSSTATAPPETKPARTTKPIPAPTPGPVPQAERTRFQTAALLAPKPAPAEAPSDDPAPQPSPPARRWWLAAAIGLVGVAIAVAAWVGLGRRSDPGASTGAIVPPVVTATSDRPSGPGTAVAGLVPFEMEPAADLAEPEPKPVVAEPEPVAVEKPPEPKPAVTEPEPVAVQKRPEPKPVVAEPEPVAVEKRPEPKPAVAEPEPVAVQKRPEPKPAVAEPEPEPTPEPELVAPVLLQRVDPAPSPKALKKHRGATIVLRLLINEQGAVIRVVVDQGIPGSELEAATVNAVLRWKFQPATRGGIPVQEWTEARFTF